eukprot:scaffold108790_cov75-Phaeocystis_antarctica.AAC.2
MATLAVAPAAAVHYTLWPYSLWLYLLWPMATTAPAAAMHASRGAPRLRCALPRPPAPVA